MVDFTLTVEIAGEYTVDFRLASQPGTDGFEIQVDGVAIESIPVNATGGWQTYETKTTTLTLPAGQVELKLNAVGAEWNLNWINFTKN